MQSTSLTYDTLNSLPPWARMATITLDEMRDVKLMNRVDTKYVLTEGEVLTLLEHMAEYGYRVQVIDGIRACRYDTLYYDTAERDMYIAHHNRQLTRQKVRTRTYVETGLTFLEVKNKNNRGRTKKRRTEIARNDFYAFADNAEARDFYKENGRHAHETISPALATRFVRITLVNPRLTERLTIDLALEYEDIRSHTRASIPTMAIVELKQDGNVVSDLKRTMLNMRIRPLKVSKYCLGTTLTVADIKHNRFKAKLRNIAKRLGSQNITIQNINL